MEATKTILAVNRWLIYNDVPDDVIMLIFQFAGDLKETPTDLVNRHCFYKVTHRKKGHKCGWFMRGTFCAICDRYLMLNTTKQLAVHKNSLGHQKNVIKHMKTDNDIHDNILERWFKDVSKHRPEIANAKDHIYQNVWIRQRNIHWKR